MSGPTQTPASKRFLATQSSSASASLSASARKPQFLRTPQAATSSPYNATPYRRRIAISDEIDTNFEDHLNDVEGAFASTNRSTQLKGTTNFDSIEDEPESEQFRSSPTFRNSASLENDQHRPIGDCTTPRSPLPKRQKRQHEKDSNQDAIVVSSSPAPGCSPSESLGQRGDDRDTTDIDEEDYADLAQEQAISSRFLVPTPVKADITPGHGKPSFKAFRHITTADESRTMITLPGAFSPSKRKGKREYIHGGAADALRSCILQIAHELSRNDLQDDTVIALKHVLTDESGRFELAEDDQNRKWMLIQQTDQPSRASLSEMADVNGYVSISMKDPMTSWALDLNDNEHLHIAVMWDMAR